MCATSVSSSTLLLYATTQMQCFIIKGIFFVPQSSQGHLKLLHATVMHEVYTLLMLHHVVNHHLLTFLLQPVPFSGCIQLWV
jgi:hypothetical protein